MESGRRVVLFTLAGNLVLTVVKALVGLLSGSMAMLAEAVHSAADVLASSGVLLGLTIAGRPPDANHPYGHGKVESLVGLAVAGVLVYIGASLGISTLALLREPAGVPGIVALWTAFLAIPAKEVMYRYTIRVARQSQSVALMADAWHHRADAIISLAVLAGIGGARLGLPLADPLVSLAICLLIGRIGGRIALKAFDQLTDACPGPERVKTYRRAVEEVTGVREVHGLRVRSYGSLRYLDVRIGVDQNLSVREGHSICGAVRECLQRHHPEVAEVLIHVTPWGGQGRPRLSGQDGMKAAFPPLGSGVEGGYPAGLHRVHRASR